MSTTLRLPTGRTTSLIAALGPDDAAEHSLDNWSLKRLQQHGDVPSNRSLVRALSQEFCGMGITEAFAPNVTRASARIIEPKELLDQIWLDGARTIRRNQYVHADGIFLAPDQAFIASAAGCGIVVASAGDYECVAHGGRDSLINRGAVVGKPTRAHISVVDAIIEQFRWLEIEPSEIAMVLLFSIPARAFEHDARHPVHGAYNRALADFADNRWPGSIIRENGTTFLDLEHVFMAQAIEAGITKVWMAHSLAEHSDLAHTRDGKGTDRRNLIIVKRES
ncbi:MAG TPA: hypothetical protein VMV62_01280 [Candidatus Paceibacterota bacterium]|nr:hypothetical protein [Candidatus Paceibacterota bacterium]